MKIQNAFLMGTLFMTVLSFVPTTFAGHPQTLAEYDRIMGTFDSRHPERFEFLKPKATAPSTTERLFSPPEYAVAAQNYTVAYEAAVRMGLFSQAVQSQLGITSIEISTADGLTIHSRDEYGTWKFFLTGYDFDPAYSKDFIKVISLGQDNRQLTKTLQIHLSPGHSAHLKKGVDMWLYIESQVANEYTHRSTEVMKTQTKITSDDLTDPRGLYQNRIKEISVQSQKKPKTCRSMF